MNCKSKSQVNARAVSLRTVSLKSFVACRATQFLLHLTVQFNLAGTFVEVSPKAFDHVSFQYLDKDHGPWMDYLKAQHPGWDPVDVVKLWFDDHDLPNIVKQSEVMKMMTPNTKRGELRKNAEVAIDPEKTQSIPSSPVSPASPVESRRSKRNRLAYDEVEDTDEEGNTVVKLVQVSTPEFKNRLIETQALDVVNHLQESMSQYDKFLQKVNAQGFIQQPKADKIKRVATKPKGPTQRQQIDKLQKLVASLHARLSMAKKAASAPAQGPDLKPKLHETTTSLMTAHAEIERLKESILDLKSECNSAKTDLAMEKLRGDGKVNKALAEVHAEYMQKFMSNNTPGSGSGSHAM